MSQSEISEPGQVDPSAPIVHQEPSQTWRKPRQQIAALPFRFDDGQLRVMLITSRETRRWVIPKGWPMRGLKPHRAAEREAYEEAGLKGHIGKVAVGTYAYEKRLANGLAVPCEVSVFPLARFDVRRSDAPHDAPRGLRPLLYWAGTIPGAVPD